MAEKHVPLFTTSYLRSIWLDDYEAFKSSSDAETLLVDLRNWADRDWQKETAAEGAFISVFFKKTWGYMANGEGGAGNGYTLEQQFPVKRAGQGGGTGEADVALGHFDGSKGKKVPHVLGEFKDDRSGLDKPQYGRQNARTPVEQCLDYLREARTGLIAPPFPTWGIVTDMNELRLYMYGNKAQYQQFIIKGSHSDEVALLDDTEEAAFLRFVFFRMLHSDWLLPHGAKSKLERLLQDQLTHEVALEKEFYREYQSFREELFNALERCNPVYKKDGKLHHLVRLTQRFLDRCLFILYLEDMGRELSFPPNILRNILMRISDDEYYHRDGPEAWSRVKQLFISMRDGTPFGSERINRFNGGLFEVDDELDSLQIPNSIFCEQGQGGSSDKLLSYPKTLLFFSAKYNFGKSSTDGSQTLTLTTMGRIFEQSITDLEVMEAKAEGRASLTEITKRKRNGVYYTPEWVTEYIVEETVGARLEEIKEDLGLTAAKSPTDADIEQYKKFLNDKRRTAKVAGAWLRGLERYRIAIRNLKIVDPACGSGAFLIQALRYLITEYRWIKEEQFRVAGQAEIWDMEQVYRDILSQNIYGVDINAESVEITRLALWLHTALPDRPLTVLDKNIRVGNSLVGHDFYEQLGLDGDLFDEAARARVNTFDWKEAFPEIFARGNAGFDCVIGNPPYVKLQHFRKIQEHVARYLVEARGEHGPLYESTQTGNFDLYLPFVERSVELLNEDGKMGFIAPNVWLVNEYGLGLRRKLKRTKRLDRWVDFKSYQVFDDAITYTSLQFYSGSPNDYFSFCLSPHGYEALSSFSWASAVDRCVFSELSEESWALLPAGELALIDKLRQSSSRLEQKCDGIVVGIQTSADYVYHLERTGPNRYRTRNTKKYESFEVEIEDSIMHPIVSGPDVQRYLAPRPSVHLLHPYSMRGEKAVLLNQEEMEKNLPLTWGYLLRFESDLRSRENGKMNHDSNWWAYIYPKNLNKQELPKLCVAETVPGMRVSYDYKGEFYFNNVRVNGIIPGDIETGWFLLGILNAPVCDYVFRRKAKPKSGGYFEANKQFIAPLPIPGATASEKAEVARFAKHLQEVHTKRRDALLAIDKRLSSSQCEDDIRDESWLWAEVKSVAMLKHEAPKGIKGRARTSWAKQERENRLGLRLEMITPVLRAGAKLTVDNQDGELSVLADGQVLIDSIFVDLDEADFIAAQWRQEARKINVTEKFDGKRLVSRLLKLKKTSNEAIVRQVIEMDAKIQRLDEEIAVAEAEMNALTYRLYNLTEEEIALVERG